MGHSVRMRTSSSNRIHDVFRASHSLRLSAGSATRNGVTGALNAEWRTKASRSTPKTHVTRDFNQESSEDTFVARDAIVDSEVTGEQVEWVAHAVVQLLDLGSGLA